MALLNPPELRPSIIRILALYLATRRANRSSIDELIDLTSPPSLSNEPSKHQRDVRSNLNAMEMLGIVQSTNDKVQLSDEATKVAKRDASTFARYLREIVLSPEHNTADWPRQEGARDLTTALSWFLTFSPDEAPQRYKGGTPNADQLQQRDFGVRQDESNDAGHWPINNDIRWTNFVRWACALGFAWQTPSGIPVPDPTIAIRDSLGEVFSTDDVLTVRDFTKTIASRLPVLDQGSYREFMERHWLRDTPDEFQLSPPTLEALERLSESRYIELAHRADSGHAIRRIGGGLFSHVVKGPEK